MFCERSGAVFASGMDRSEFLTLQLGQVCSAMSLPLLHSSRESLLSFNLPNLPPPDIGFDFDFSDLKKKSRKKRGSTSTLHQHQSLDMVIFKTRKKEEDFHTDAGLTGFRFVDLELFTDFVDLVSKL